MKHGTIASIRPCSYCFALITSLLLSGTGQAGGLVNGAPWFDTDGHLIQAHGGSMLRVGEYTYWFGEDKSQGAPTQAISCYRSRDHEHWEFRGHALDASAATIIQESNLERPKVLFNKKTQLFVMWLHREAKDNYAPAEAAVAVAEQPEGPYRWLRSFRPLQQMSRDVTLFLEEDGRAYLLSAARDNNDLNVYRLTADFQDIEAQVNTLFAGKSREAPAVFRSHDRVYLVTSGCTGWTPNQAMVASGPSLEAPNQSWSPLTPLGSPSTFNAQSAFVMPSSNDPNPEYVLFLDRWIAQDLSSSRYLALPLRFKDSALTLEFQDFVYGQSAAPYWNFSKTPSWEGKRIRLHSVQSNLQLSVQDSGELLQNSGTDDPSAIWTLIRTDSGDWQIQNNKNQGFLGLRTGDGKLTLLDSPSQGSSAWTLQAADQHGFAFHLIHKQSGLALDVLEGSTRLGAKVDLYRPHDTWNQKWYPLPAF